MQSVVSKSMISFEAAVWAKAGVVWAGFTIVDSSVSSTTCKIAAHNTFELLVLAQEVEPTVQSLSIWMRPLPGMANSGTWGSRRDVPGGQSFNNGFPVSDVGSDPVLL